MRPAPPRRQVTLECFLRERETPPWPFSFSFPLLPLRPLSFTFIRTRSRVTGCAFSLIFSSRRCASDTLAPKEPRATPRIFFKGRVRIECAAGDTVAGILTNINWVQRQGRVKYYGEGAGLRDAVRGGVKGALIPPFKGGEQPRLLERNGS